VGRGRGRHFVRSVVCCLSKLPSANILEKYFNFIEFECGLEG
jgi:hypothetical protein